MFENNVYTCMMSGGGVPKANTNKATRLLK